MDSSQAAMAEARRLKLAGEYAVEVERMKAEAAKKKSAGRPKTSEKELSQIVDEVPADDRKVTAQRAKSAGTNRQYIADADKIEAERPNG